MIPELYYNGPNKDLNFTDHQNFYLNALYSTLKWLKPTHCVEIGTNHGRSTVVFQDYMDEEGINGLTTTLDIKKYTDLSRLNKVRQLEVYPHSEESLKWHYVNSSDLLKFEDDLTYEDSLDANIAIVFKDANISLDYDFAFIDGDHLRSSLLKDIEMCKTLLKDGPQYMLIDDIDKPEHDCSKVFYEELTKEYNWYDFSDWKNKPGVGLIWK